MAWERASRSLQAFAAVAAAALATSAAPEARGQAGGSATGDLGVGGTARGDISTASGENDLVDLDAQAGQKLKLSLVADFHAAVELLDPSGAAVPLTFSTGAVVRGTSAAIDVGGKYSVRISSADGSQGGYTLTAAARWPSSFAATSRSGDPLDFVMPQDGVVTATIKAKPTRAWNPQIVALSGPGGAPLLLAPIVGAKGVARLPKTHAVASGAHVLSVVGGPSGATFRATLLVKAPPIRPTSIDIRNGLTDTGSVSFSNDGVARIFRNRCAGCHGWAGSYSGVQSEAGRALAYIEAGFMPLGGGRLSNANVTLIRNWIDTGEHR